MDSQEQSKTPTASVVDPYSLRLKCFLCQAINPNVNDENNNLKKRNSNPNGNSFNPILKFPLYTCPDCEAKIRLEEKETTISNNSTMISQQNQHDEQENLSNKIVTSSDSDSDDDDDEQCWCSACVCLMDEEEDSKSRQLWDQLSHLIKCLYRSTDKDFSENQFSNEISKVKKYVKKLTKLNPQLLFKKLELIALEYVREIRKQVFERYQTCSRSSHDVHLFITYLLDEYQIFVQTATNVSTILFDLEENYLKRFHLTWLLFNKHLYEELIYMDRKIHHSMSTMIDLLQPATDEENPTDDSPSEYSQLLSRFLAFDEEMSEVAYLYKDSQSKMLTKSLEIPLKNGFQSKFSSKKICKKSLSKRKLRSTTTTMSPAVDIPSTTTTSLTSAANEEIEQSSNGSSIGSELGGEEFSSVSSMDDNLLDHETSSSGYTQEEQEELANLIFNDDDMNEFLFQEILSSVSPYARFSKEYEQQFQMDLIRDIHQQNTTTIQQNDEWIRRIIQGEPILSPNEMVTTDSTSNENNSKEIKDENSLSTNSPPPPPPPLQPSTTTTKKTTKSSASRRRKESSMCANANSTTTTTTTQIPKKSIDADLLLPRSIADISAKIQSVSFTAGTFGSITTTKSNEISSSPSINSTLSKPTTTGQTRLSINLTRKPTFKPTEHGGQKIAEALFNELTSLGNGEISTSRENSSTGRKKDSQHFKKPKQLRTNSISSTINETLASLNNNSLFSSSSSSSSSTNKSDTNNSSSTAYNNLDQLLRHAASNAEVSEAALHSILSSFQSPTSLDTTKSSPSKHSISSKATETLQALIAQQQYHHHHHQHRNTRKNLSENSKRCEFCCCDFAEGRPCSTSTCLHLPTPPSSSSSSCSSSTTSTTTMTNNGSITGCVTCMALPGATTTTTSVMGTTITGAFNQRGIEAKERLKLKLTKRTVQSLTEQHQSPSKDSIETEKPSTKKKSTEKKTTINETNTKPKEFLINDKNDIDDLVRFIDGDDKISSNGNEHSTTSTNHHESSSKKNKKKKEKQNKSNGNQQEKTNGTTAPTPIPTPTIAATATITTNSTEKISAKPPVQAEQPTSKRKQKAKSKQQQQQQQQHEKEKEKEKEETKSSEVTVSSLKNGSSTQETTPKTESISRSKADHPPKSLDLPEEEQEEVNWITISRKQSKHKPTPPSVPSLLATPILPVVPLTNTKQHRQTASTQVTTKKINPSSSSSSTTVSPIVQQKVISSTSNLTAHPSLANHPKPQIQPTTNGASGRPQNLPKPSPSSSITKIEPTPPIQSQTNLWKTNQIHENSSVMTPPPPPSFSSASATALTSLTSSILHGNVPLMPPSVLLSPTRTTNPSLISDEFPPTIGWDSNRCILPTDRSVLSLQPSLLPTTTPGPVQRPHPSFSPAPGPISNTASRCIQRPSPEPRPSSSSSSSTANTPFPQYYPMNYVGIDPSSTWHDTTQWKYPSSQDDQGHYALSNSSNDFPLYDPFHSGAGLTIPTASSSLLQNGFPESFPNASAVPQPNDFNDMDALDKEIEDFKKFCFESIPLETREKVQVNIDRCFVRQA